MQKEITQGYQGEVYLLGRVNFVNSLKMPVKFWHTHSVRKVHLTLSADVNQLINYTELNEIL